ncbi:Glutathione peroxidase 2 [Coemansia sp. BCRC 34490]|nr:Glutathione peroxidase 2 [Coemansia sp. BCRC 34490]
MADSAKYNEDFYALSFKTLEGEEYPFEQLRDKVVLVVNVASKCGFTSQYKGLEKLYKEMRTRDLLFLGQEPGEAKDIQSFCSTTYGVSFPIMEKSDVNGDHENPVFAYLKGEKAGIMGLKRIKWNFEKFIVDRHGFVVQRYASTTSPQGIEGEISKYLEQN